MTARRKAQAFCAVALLQLAVPGWLMVERELALWRGETYCFLLAPADPVDTFRGRYMALRYRPEDVTVPEGGVGEGDTAYVTVEPVPPRDLPAQTAAGEPVFYRLGRAGAEPPEAGPYVRTRFRSEFAPRGGMVDMPNRYYMNEYVAPRADAAVRHALAQRHRVYAELRLWRGIAVLTGLYVDGQTLEDWCRANESTIAGPDR